MRHYLFTLHLDEINNLKIAPINENKEIEVDGDINLLGWG